jgi:MSHA biogenesis protein MshK
MKALLPMLAICMTAAAHADALRDPTRPPHPAGAHAGAQEAAPALTAVFLAGDRRTAIFNGRLVRAGDRVGSYTIEAVLDSGVRYRHGGTVHELLLPHPADTVKKPAAAPARGASGGQ